MMEHDCFELNLCPNCLLETLEITYDDGDMDFAMNHHCTACGSFFYPEGKREYLYGGPAIIAQQLTYILNTIAERMENGRQETI